MSAAAPRSTIFAEVHHGHFVGHVGDDAQIVSDEHDRHVQLGLQTLHQFKDLGFGRNVQRGGGFVCDEKTGVAGEGHGDHHTLAHAAAELVSESVHALLRQRNMHLLQHIDGDIFGFGLRYGLMQQDIFGYLVTNFMDRAKRGAGLLEDHCDFAAADGAHFSSGSGKLQQVHDGALPVFVRSGVEDFAVYGVSRRPYHAHDGACGDAFAAAAFANHAEDLAATDRKGCAVYGLGDPFGHKEVGLQVSYFKQCVHRLNWNCWLIDGSWTESGTGTASFTGRRTGRLRRGGHRQ